MKQTRNASAIFTMAIACLFCVPLVFQILSHLGKSFPPTRELFNRPGLPLLLGTELVAPAFPFSIESWLDGSWQQSFANDFNARYSTRNLAARLTNELYFRVFHRPGNARSKYRPGKGFTAFTQSYFESHAFVRPSEKEVQRLVDVIENIRTNLAEHGVETVFVLTPSKTTFHPEWVPDYYGRNFRESPPLRSVLIPALKQSGIPFIDGVQVVEEAVRDNQLHDTPFNIGGIHWSKEAAFFVAREVVGLLKNKRFDLRDLEIDHREWLVNPCGITESDVKDRMNLLLPWDYNCITARTRATPAISPGPALAAVGGSFTFEILTHLGDSKQFSDISFFFYWNKGRFFQLLNMPEIAGTSPRPDIRTEILRNDIVLVELNESYKPSKDHLQWFWKALKNNKSHTDTAFLELNPGDPPTIPARLSRDTQEVSLPGFSGSGALAVSTKKQASQVRLRFPEDTQPESVSLLLGLQTRNPLEKVAIGISVNGVPQEPWIPSPNNPEWVKIPVARATPKKAPQFCVITLELPKSVLEDGGELFLLKVAAENMVKAREL